MRQDQKEYRELLAGLLGFRSVLREVWGVGNLRQPLVSSSEIAPMKLPDRSSGHHLPAETSSRDLRQEIPPSAMAGPWLIKGTVDRLV